MKFIFGIFALCLLVANAIIIDEFDIDKAKSEMNQIYKEVADSLQHQIYKNMIYPLKQVKVAVRSIEALRKENDACVAAEDEKYLATIDFITKSIEDCSNLATKKATNIIGDITATVQQMAENYNKLKWGLQGPCFKNPFSIIYCYYQWIKQKDLYEENYRKSIEGIKHSAKERIYYVVADVDTCTHKPFDEAIYEFGRIYKQIKNCLDKPK